MLVYQAQLGASYMEYQMRMWLYGFMGFISKQHGKSNT